MSLFEAAEQAKNNALERVEAHADPIWMELAIRTVQRLARERQTFTTDDLWSAISQHPVREPRALGAVMRKAAKYGWIRSTDRVVKSVRRENHRRPVTLWESRL